MELKRCPFCGGRAEIYCSPLSPASDVVVECTNCHAGTAFYNDGPVEELKAKAIAAWNRRYGDGSL